MDYATDVLIIVSLFTIFGVIHSILASIKIKILFKKYFDKVIAFYRLIYNLLSLIMIYLIWEISQKNSFIIFELSYPYDLLTLIPQIIALAGLVWTFKYINFKEFLGISQIQRFFDEKYNSELDEDMTLRIEGPYRFTRHPVYFFSILLLLFRPVMELSYLTFFLCIVTYFYIGSIYEEKKLLKYFGDIYKKYQESVPRIFPVKFFQPYSQSEIVKTQ